MDQPAAPIQPPRHLRLAEPSVAAEDLGRVDAAMVAGLRRGDARAMAEAWSRYHLRIHSFLLRLCRQPELAEDLLQETFERLGRHGPQLPAETPLLPWLYTVSRNLYRSELRKRVGWLRRFPLLHGDFEPPAPTPWTQTVARDESRRLEAALLGLADAYREALLLVCVDGMPPEQAAKVLDIDPATLRKRLSRGRAHLRTALGEELP